MPLKRLDYTYNFIKPHILSFILLLFIVLVLDFINANEGAFQGKKRTVKSYTGNPIDNPC
ncbi:hypothetical protein [uncultured Methanobrevibacter sp.]|uniref:hypothetical protein n=1 Tax=uncultured Methanobrevibacter sp. TaxID=253161 RepID=UPI0025F64BD8|nr:hypothetical protein [uncultured Methanobrevibacter sp.]